MSTGRRWGGRASGNRGEELKRPQELDAFSIEHPRRPEVWIINRYAVVAAYVRIVLRGIGALALLWATVVLLGGFVSSLKKVDFWYLTAIAFIQAAGVFNAVGDARFVFIKDMGSDLALDLYFGIGKYHLAKKINRTLASIFSSVMYCLGTMVPSCVCIIVSLNRLRNQYIAVAYRDASEANLKRALKLFYYLTIAHSIIWIFHLYIDSYDQGLVNISKRYGYSFRVLCAYLRKTKEMCENNPASIERWNLITYSVGLLDSELPEDYVSGGQVLDILINQEKSLAIRELLIRSQRPRIQKLIGTLAWRSPAEQEMRWHAARIVEQLAGHLNLALFPGALECISSLFDQEALLLTFITLQGTDDDLVLIGLRILENLSHDTHNCTLIYRTNDLISKIVAPLSSNELIEDMKSSTAWTKVVDVSLKVVSRLTCSSAMTGQKMCKLIANSSNAVKNLEAILDMKSDSGIIELQMRAVEVLTQLALHHPARSAIRIRENLIQHTLHIFLTTDWIADYLKHEKSKIDIPTTSQQNASPGEAREARAEKKMKEAQETASQFKENKFLAISFWEAECTCKNVLEQLLSVQQDEPFTLLNNGKPRRLHAELLSLVTAIRANHNLNLEGILLSQTPPDTLEKFVVRLKKMVDDNMYPYPACLAIQKHTCHLVTEFMKHDQHVEVINRHNIVATLLEASKVMAQLESRMLFAGVHQDRHGVPLKPLFSVLAKQAEYLLTQRKQALGITINIVPASAPIP